MLCAIWADLTGKKNTNISGIMYKGRFGIFIIVVVVVVVVVRVLLLLLLLLLLPSDNVAFVLWGET